MHGRLGAGGGFAMTGGVVDVAGIIKEYNSLSPIKFPSIEHAQSQNDVTSHEVKTYFTSFYYLNV